MAIVHTVDYITPVKAGDKVPGAPAGFQELWIAQIRLQVAAAAGDSLVGGEGEKWYLPEDGILAWIMYKIAAAYDADTMTIGSRASFTTGLEIPTEGPDVLMFQDNVSVFYSEYTSVTGAAVNTIPMKREDTHVHSVTGLLVPLREAGDIHVSYDIYAAIAGISCSLEARLGIYLKP